MTKLKSAPKEYRNFIRIPVRVPECPNVRKFVYVSRGVVYINLNARPEAKLIEYYP